MTLINIWGEIEPIFNSDLLITKEYFFNSYQRYEIRYSKELFIEKLKAFVNKHYSNLKKFELLNGNIKNANNDSFIRKSESATTGNNRGDSTSKDQYTGFGVDGDFKKTINNSNSVVDSNNTSTQHIDPLEIWNKIEIPKEPRLLEPFLKDAELLFVTIFSINI